MLQPGLLSNGRIQVYREAETYRDLWFRTLTVRLAPHIPMPFDHIPRVLGVRARDKVSRIHAWTVVARMAHKLAGRDGSVMENVRHLMRRRDSERLEDSVSILDARPLPFPARSHPARAVNLGPEPLWVNVHWMKSYHT